MPGLALVTLSYLLGCFYTTYMAVMSGLQLQGREQNPVMYFSICISTLEGFLPFWNDSFHPGINPSRMEGILPGSYQNLGMTAIPKIQVQYL